MRRSAWERLTALNAACLLFGLAALALWLYARDEPKLVRYALWIAIVADAFAAVPSFLYYLKYPGEDRPFSWITFSIGYALSLLAITDLDWHNYVLGIYMSVGGFAISLPLIVYRVRYKIPLREWI